MKPLVIPASHTAPEFGKVTVWLNPTSLEVEVTILGEPQGREAEGWRTGLALDASSSMQDAYGRRLLGKVPSALLKEYITKGWVEERQADGRPLRVFQREAYDDAIARGHLKFTPNLVEPCAREWIAYLAGNLDAHGETAVIYWACGSGEQIEALGDISENRASQTAIHGPIQTTFGIQTHLLPALRYFAERFAAARRGMYLFITDGRIDDFAAVTRYSTQLARAIEAGQRHPLKAVLIGLGDKIDPTQMEALDTLDTGTAVDLWDCKYVREMRSLRDIFAEVVSEHQIVAPTATLYDHQGTVVKKYTDGVPARLRVALPAGCPAFELDVLGRRIRQSLSLHP